MHELAPPLFTHAVVRARWLMETVRRHDAEAVLQGMLHTIFFLRLLGTLEPATRNVLGTELVRRVLT